MNTSKTEFMLIGSREKLSILSSQPELSIDNVPLEKVTCVKSLGIFIDENLRWQAHIDKLSKTFPSGAIKRIRDFVPTPTLHCIYNALIQSQFDYCNIVWGNCGKTLFDRLQKLQNRAARVLTFSRYDAYANRLFRQLNWKDLSTQFQIQKALMVYKSLNDLVPGYLSSKFVKRYETRYSLRDSVNKVIVPFPRTNFMKNSFSYSGAVLWNCLPCEMREANSLSQFKRLAHLNFWFLNYCVLGIHEKQVLVRLFVDSFGLFIIFLYSWWILLCLNKELFYSIPFKTSWPTPSLLRNTPHPSPIIFDQPLSRVFVEPVFNLFDAT